MNERQVKGKIQHSFLKFRKFCGIGELQKRDGQPIIYGWFVRELCSILERFKEEMEAGNRPLYVIEAPPQVGKSICLQDFTAWMCGLNPDLRIIFASFSDDLGIRANKSLQTTMSNDAYKWLFGDLINSDNVRNMVGSQRNDHQIDFVGFSGSFVNTTSQGQITGKSCDLMIIDDPIKGREQANSETMRNKVWNWFTNDAMTRMSPKSGTIIINTRWHLEDLAGKVMASGMPYKRFTFKAIAEEDEEHRLKGEVLVPEYKGIEFYNNFRQTLSEADWQSLFQQNPVVEGGNLFKADWFETIDFISDTEMDYTFITADTSYTSKQSSDYTVFTHWGRKDNKLFRLDSLRDKRNAVEVEEWAESWIRSKINKKFRYIWIEPQGHGVYLNQSFRKKGLPIPYEQDLKEWLVRKTDKTIRANAVIPLISRGVAGEEKNVVFSKRCKDHYDFIGELIAFPNGKHDDTIDTFIDGLNIGFNKRGYDWKKIVDL